MNILYKIIFIGLYAKMKNIYKKFDKPVHVNNRNFQKDAPLTQDLIKLQDEIASKFPVNKKKFSKQ